MTALNAIEHEKLKQAIQELEKDVLGELVVVVAKSSDSYRFIPTLWAALIALVLPGIYLLSQWFFDGGWTDSASETDLSTVYFVQVTVFFGLFMAFQWPPIQRLIIPSAIFRQRASRLAHEQFLVQRLHHTTERCGALVFISLLEHHVEIMVDQGLAKYVDNTYWAGTISRMSPLLRRGDIASACDQAIVSMSEAMHTHCPRGSNTPKDNELADHIIEL